MVDGGEEGFVVGEKDGVFDNFAVGDKDSIIDGNGDGCEDGALVVVGWNEGIVDGEEGCNVIVTLATPGVVVRSIELAVMVRDLPELAKLSSV
mmetsp:Transcript_22104/g.32092  ORF Transcript_22104/g.32092 Transcript_22104/m.32092 type:complete len:93 (+) Transcript_22104:413-691(+)